LSFSRHVIDRRFRNDRARCGLQENPGTADVVDGGVVHCQCRIGAWLEIDAVLREILDGAILHRELCRLHEADAIGTERRARAIDGQTTQGHYIAGTGVHDDALHARSQNAADIPDAFYGDRLRDRDGAEATRVQHIDDAAGRGFRNCARERLARRGTAARIGIVADP